MGFVKLQFGCLLVILYIIITYLKAISKGKIFQDLYMWQL